jgi:hypothetical protein
MSVYTLGYNVAKSVARLPGIIDLIQKIKKGNKVEYKPEVTFGNIDDIISDCGQFLFEIDKCYKDHEWVSKTCDMTVMFNIARKKIFELKKKEADIVEYLEPLTILKSTFSEEYSAYRSIWSWNFDNLFRKNFCDNMDTLFDEWLEILKRSRANRPLNLLDVNTEVGENILRIKEENDNNKIYAISHLEGTQGKLSTENRKKFERFLVGGLHKVIVTNDAFDIVYCCPSVEIDTDTYEKNVVFSERRMLDKAYIYLRKNGILVYTLPLSRFTKQVSLYLSRGLSDIQILKNEFTDKYGIVTIVGIKPPAKERIFDEKMYARLRNLYWTEDYDNEIMVRTLPSDIRRIEKFRGTVMDDVELQEAFIESNAMKTFWKEQKVEKLSETKKKPLLPFTIGQLGLVLTSGCLDGVVQEEDGCAHCVKGRVVKVTESKRDFNEDGQTVDVVETTRNRVEISMFLPDGSYRCLA